MRIDLSVDGWDMIFKPYPLKAMEHIWSLEGKGASSKQVWDAIGHSKISRASVINFLNDMVEEGYLQIREITGKVGHRRIYHMTWNADRIVISLMERVAGKMGKLLFDVPLVEFEELFPIDVHELQKMYVRHPMYDNDGNKIEQG